MYTSFALFALSALSVTAAPQRGATPPTSGQKVIYPNGNTSKCLSAASNSNGAAVAIQDCVKTNTPASQLWTVQGGTFRIFGDKCLDDTNGVKTNGQKMQIYTCAGNKNQQWSQTGGSIQLSGTSKCLDNTNGSTKNGNPVCFLLALYFTFAYFLCYFAGSNLGLHWRTQPKVDCRERWRRPYPSC